MATTHTTTSLQTAKTKFYQHQTLIYFITGIFIHIMIFVPFFALDGIFVQDDFAFHRLRLENYVTAVQNGDFFPKIFPSMANGYGYAADLFYPSILLLPYVGLRWLGFSYINSFYLYHLLISLATFFTAYLALNKVFQSSNKAFIFAIIYSTATYRFLDQFIRGALGETLAFIFIPLVLWGFYEILSGKAKHGVVLAIGMALLLYSHLITTFIVALVLLAVCFYLLVKHKLTMTHVFVIIKAALIAFALCAFTLLPMLEQSLSITFNFSQANGIWFDALNYSMADLVIGSLKNSAAVWENLEPNIGILLLLSILVSFFSFKQQSKLVKSLTIVNLIVMVIATNLFPWSIIKESIFGIIQFPWRWLTILTFTASLLATVKISENMSVIKSFLLTSFIILITSVSYSGNIIHQFNQAQTNFITNDNYADFFLSSVGGGREYIPVEANYQTLRENKQALPQHSEAVTHERIANEYKSQTWLFISDSDQEKVLLPNLTYVGYEVLIDDQPTEIMHEQGLITIQIPNGSHQVKITYVGTFIQKISLIVTLVTWLTILLMGIFRRVRT
ncbi:YfhO family protein [Fundicoccus culcitae]|uniref:YfhO family protein n=1 Tax=Fundicoccus culcitae TaxID=2969821 RepID=A0ABY5P6S5_9LACT|nr:YfhO family protein [Fundicoccus culcitae]UUX34128.1 YfhO family protein [Fundicoccus culcitae]